MESPFRVFIGRRVNGVQQVHDYFQLDIGDGIVTVYNPFKLTAHGADIPEDVLIGKTLQTASVDNSHHLISLSFDEQFVLEIDISEESYRGPEGVTIHYPGEPFIVI